MSEQHDGGCHCGAVRFRVTGPVQETGYCHCRICQRLSGAPAQAYATFAPDALIFTKGRPKTYRSSDWGERLFCPDCGAQMIYRERENPTEVSINICSFDEPAAFVPAEHIFMEDRVPWFDPKDGLPRAARYPGDAGAG